MILKRAAITGLLVLSLTSAAQPAALARSATVDLPKPNGGGQHAKVEVGHLPLDLQRIHHLLQQSTVREERSGLSVRYVIEVFGRAPPLLVLTKVDNLVNAPVPYGAPTHWELLEYLIPKEYRAPAAYSALISRFGRGIPFRWLAERDISSARYAGKIQP